MSHNPHPIPAEWLSAYSDGELDAARRAQVEAHLPSCTGCQSELAELKLLSRALSAGELAREAVTDETAFWRSLQPQLPGRLPASTHVGGGSVLPRWLPGIGLLLINNLVHVVGGVTAVFLLFAPRLPAVSTWAAMLNSLAVGSVIGWPAWLIPTSWTGLGLYVFFTMMSVWLAVLYLAWLGYELRYGPPATASVAAA